MRSLLTVAGLLGAIVALGQAFTTHVGVSMIGFPDGHVTDYGAAVRAPLEYLAWAEALLGCLFLVFAFCSARTRVRSVGLLVTVIAVVGVVLVVKLGVPWYFGTHLALDNGIGG
jgi:MFS superfamily sulfate permease-like transporter